MGASTGRETLGVVLRTRPPPFILIYDPWGTKAFRGESPYALPSTVVSNLPYADSYLFTREFGAKRLIEHAGKTVRTRSRPSVRRIVQDTVKHFGERIVGINWWPFPAGCPRITIFWDTPSNFNR